MRGKKAKAIRALVYKQHKADPRERTYFVAEGNPTTIHADRFRQVYQRIKKENS